jgi:HPt (histidine-containing phosphotransfer) domain-containing protein
MSHIDLNTFNALKESMGTDFIGELLDAFFNDAPTLIAQMRSALTSQDVEIFRRAAHSMKSNAATFGALELAALAKELENLARANNLEVGDKVEKIEVAYRQAESQLKSLK